MPGLSEGDARLSTSAHPRNASRSPIFRPGLVTSRLVGGCLIPRRHLDTGNSGKGSSNEGAISYPSRVPKSRRRSGAILSAASRKGGGFDSSSSLPCLFFAPALATYSQAQAVTPVMRGPWLGQTPPGESPVAFAPELFATLSPWVEAVDFSPDGKLCLIGIGSADYSSAKIYASSLVNGGLDALCRALLHRGLQVLERTGLPGRWPKPPIHRHQGIGRQGPLDPSLLVQGLGPSLRPRLAYQQRFRRISRELHEGWDYLFRFRTFRDAADLQGKPRRIGRPCRLIGWPARQHGLHRGPIPASRPMAAI